MSSVYTDRDLVILVPVLDRPHRVAPLMRSIARATPRAHVFFIPSPNEEPELEALHAALAVGYGPRMSWMEYDGNYAAKINMAVAATDEPWIFLGADDLEFHPGWFEVCMNAAFAHWEGSLIVGMPPPVVVGTNDLGNARVCVGEHSTHSLALRSYVQMGTIDQPGVLLHEEYPHEFVDDEFVETAKARGAYVHAHDAHVEHLHPSWGKALTDWIYDQQRIRMRVGRRIYRSRRPLWSSNSN